MCTCSACSAGGDDAYDQQVSCRSGRSLRENINIYAIIARKLPKLPSGHRKLWSGWDGVGTAAVTLVGSIAYFTRVLRMRHSRTVLPEYLIKRRNGWKAQIPNVTMVQLKGDPSPWSDGRPRPSTKKSKE